jgi:hypothetical protein
MVIRKVHYESLLADYSTTSAAIALLKQYRPYLEMLPSMRRSEDSIIPIPLPVVRVRQEGAGVQRACQLACDIAILMCDPEWKIKTGIEVFVFIHRPEEDFSDLLQRWRQTQVLLSQSYEWDMPLRHRQIMSEGADQIFPLFILFHQTPDRIKRGLDGAFLPYICHTLETELEDAEEVVVTESLWSNQDELLE